jgi:hypothetical protein
MNRQAIIRIAAVLIGAAVLFGLEQGLGIKLYIAIPAGVLAYAVTRVALTLMLGTGSQAK